MASEPTRLHIRVDRFGFKCETQKACYRTRAEALDACEWQMAVGRVSPGCHITPYRCERCSWWHTTNRRIVFTDASDNPARGRGLRRG